MLVLVVSNRDPVMILVQAPQNRLYYQVGDEGVGELNRQCFPAEGKFFPADCSHKHLLPATEDQQMEYRESHDNVLGVIHLLAHGNWDSL